MSGRLTTHVLDTARGLPAGDLRIDLWCIVENERTHLGTFKTNDDGRVSRPLLAGNSCKSGIYELVFQAGEYHSLVYKSEKDIPNFLNEIPIRFRLKSGEHYHVPLLLSPYGYSTYRGS